MQWLNCYGNCVCRKNEKRKKEKTHTVIKFATKGDLYKKLKKKKRIREKGYKNRKKREWDKGLLWWLHILFIRPSR